MKRMKKDDKPKQTKEQFLFNVMEMVNKGIHSDLANSEDYLERHELSNYIDDEKGLNLEAINANEDLTVHDVIEIGMHYARFCTHKNLHAVMEEAAGKAGIKVQTDVDVQVIGDDLSKLPPEVKDALRKLLGGG